MPLLDFVCPAGHETEREVKWDCERIRCPECGARADQVWLSRRSGHRHLTDPVVVFKLPNGTYSFPGESSKRTPAGAERIEMRTFADYNRTMRQVNQQHESQTRRHDERLHERHEQVLARSRVELREMVATGDPLTRDLAQHALDTYNSDRPQSSFGSIYSEAMEFDSSNRDRDPRGRK